jgi:hypothetical protein
MRDDGVEDRLGSGVGGHAPIVADELPDLLPEDHERPGLVKRVALLALALLFLLLGIVGWLLPVVTGVPFYVLAAITAGLASRRVAAWVNRHERRLPRRWRLLLRPRLRRALRAKGRPPRD